MPLDCSRRKNWFQIIPQKAFLQSGDTVILWPLVARPFTDETKISPTTMYKAMGTTKPGGQIHKLNGLFDHNVGKWVGTPTTDIIYVKKGERIELKNRWKITGV